jgi:hypothetical protein
MPMSDVNVAKESWFVRVLQLALWPLVGLIGLVLTLVVALSTPRLRLVSPLVAVLLLAAMWLAGCVVYETARFILTSPKQRRIRLAVFESNYGRDAGWFVERAGRCVAILSEPRAEDMFGVSYRIEPTTTDPQERQQLLTSPEFWWQPERLVFRNRQFDLTVSFALPSCAGPSEGRISMRRLYLPLSKPNLWEALILRLRGDRIGKPIPRN